MEGEGVVFGEGGGGWGEDIDGGFRRGGAEGMRALRGEVREWGG